MIDRDLGNDEKKPLTVPEEPPTFKRTRQSRWAMLLEKCRAHPGEWRRIVAPLKRTTAAQMASDIRNVHDRDSSKSRLRGFKPGDRFEAVAGNSPDDSDPSNHYIWLGYIGDGAPQVS